MLGGAVGLAHAAPTPPSETQRQQRETVDLLSDAGAIIDGAVIEDDLGSAVGGAGDVNGDGIDDVIVGAPLTDDPGNDSGSAYVIFGKPSFRYFDLAPTTYASSLSLDNLGRDGFRMRLHGWRNSVGESVAGAGDVNGDGLDDVIVGAPGSLGGKGAAYVVFGKRSSREVDLDQLDEDGFSIAGAVSGDNAGRSVAGTGDVNGDGLDDVIVGAFMAHIGPTSRPGAAYVVFGKRSAGDIDLAHLDEGGYRIAGERNIDMAGLAVAGTGDVNGDTVPDAIVGAPRAASEAHAVAGVAYVVFGKGSTGDVDLAQLDDGGFKIEGATPPTFMGNRTGKSVAGVADVNGDRLADVIVGAPEVDIDDQRDVGAAYVVFGKSGNTGTIYLDNFEDSDNTAGFRIDGADEGAETASAVSGVGDMNGDGNADVIVGAEWADNNDRVNSGSSYVVYGKGSSDPVALSDFGDRGFRIDGAAGINTCEFACLGDHAGASVASAGDVDGDGCTDVIIGAPGASHYMSFQSGSAYIISGCAGQGSQRIKDDPACERRHNRFGVTGFHVDTPDSHFAYSQSGVESDFIACSSEIGTAKSYAAAGAESQFMRFDIRMPPGVEVNTNYVPPEYIHRGRLNLSVLTWRGQP